MRDESWRAIMVEFSSFSSGKETGDRRGRRGTFLVDHFFNSDVVPKTSVPFDSHKLII